MKTIIFLTGLVLTKMIKIEIENVDVGAANRDYVKNYVNSPTFKKSKKIMNRARRTGYVPFNVALSESLKSYKSVFEILNYDLFHFVQSMLKDYKLTDYSEKDDNSYFVLWFGLEGDEKFEINISFNFTRQKVVVFINRVFITGQSGNGIMTELFRTIDSAMKMNLIKYKVELEDHSDKMEDGRTRWQHLFDKLNGIKVEYI